MSSQQVTVSSSLVPQSEASSRQTAGGSKGKPRFAEFACSHTQVIHILPPHLVAKVGRRRYTASLLWSQRRSFRSSYGEATTISTEL